jgi:hypothetical protein
MPTDLPIACSLTATELPTRLAEMRAIGGNALFDAERDGRRATLRFRATGDTHKRLSAIVAAESECCGFLEMTLAEQPQSIELAIVAPAEAEAVLDRLFAAFIANRQAA